ncbi:hypothetical protein CN918_32205 [Priestia megaterium]|nr:hypothetical protein CN918_32205 [Priestia megaterium]
MSSNTVNQEQSYEVTIEGASHQENINKTLLQLDDDIARFIQNKEIMNERKEENDILKDRIRANLESLGTHEYFSELPNGTYGKAINRVRISEKLDKDSLAATLNISKEELKTPFDYSKLTSKGILTPDMVSKHMQTQSKPSIGISRVKKKPKGQKEKDER